MAQLVHGVADQLIEQILVDLLRLIDTGEHHMDVPGMRVASDPGSFASPRHAQFLERAAGAVVDALERSLDTAFHV